ncbi:unnamed protein product [Ranitomeya imitator]|uniref:Uncharacterized protein n=1 Tax=Ranitomeya imitator TaxID=111125 RepID=A0ABN9M4S5_9NEOB|nr:unnamed protein product [Ranitomeya imitator]
MRPSSRPLYPAFIQQAACARAIGMLAQESSELCDQMIRLRVVHHLLYVMGNMDHTESQRQASLAVQYFASVSPVVEEQVRLAIGEKLFQMLMWTYPVFLCSCDRPNHNQGVFTPWQTDESITKTTLQESRHLCPLRPFGGVFCGFFQAISARTENADMLYMKLDPIQVDVLVSNQVNIPSGECGSGTVTLSDAAAIPTTMSIAAASLFGRGRAVTQTALQRPTMPLAGADTGCRRSAEKQSAGGQTALVKTSVNRRHTRRFSDDSGRSSDEIQFQTICYDV